MRNLHQIAHLPTWTYKVKWTIPEMIHWHHILKTWFWIPSGCWAAGRKRKSVSKSNKRSFYPVSQWLISWITTEGRMDYLLGTSASWDFLSPNHNGWRHVEPVEGIRQWSASPANGRSLFGICQYYAYHFGFEFKVDSTFHLRHYRCQILVSS